MDETGGMRSDQVSATEQLQLFLPAAALSGNRPKPLLFILDGAVY